MVKKTKNKGGRPKGSKGKKTKAKKIEEQKAMKVFKDMVLKKWGPLITAKLNLAEGVYYERTLFGNKKLTRIYKKAPDGGAIEYLISMIVGKPKDETPPPVSITIQLSRVSVKKAEGRIKKKKKYVSKKKYKKAT